jgi:hypothetical protein
MIEHILRCRRSSVTIHAPTHREWSVLIDFLHRFDRTVAGLTTHARVHVALMREMGKIRELMNSDPFKGLS